MDDDDPLHHKREIPARSRSRQRLFNWTGKSIITVCEGRLAGQVRVLSGMVRLDSTADISSL
jgi:hypothetical protein